MRYCAAMTILGMGNLLERYINKHIVLKGKGKKFNLSVKDMAVIGELIGLSKAHIFLFLQPSEQNTYADIEAAYRCLEESYGTKQEDIILYGQSVGSGPTLDLAARLPQLRAVVLHSPILSGLRVMYPVKRTYWFDIYKVTESFISLFVQFILLIGFIYLCEYCKYNVFFFGLFVCRILIKFHLSIVLFLSFM